MEIDTIQAKKQAVTKRVMLLGLTCVGYFVSAFTKDAAIGDVFWLSELGAVLYAAIRSVRLLQNKDLMQKKYEIKTHKSQN